MAVLIPNGSAALARRREVGRNSMGERVAAEDFGALGEAKPSQIEQDSQGGWRLALDDTFWPVRAGDAVRDDTGRVFVIETADLLRNAFDSTVDYVLCTALEVGPDGGRPATPWNVGR